MISTHNLQFESCADPLELIPGLHRFKVGTCQGRWGNTGNEYYILSITNDIPGNGHFNDVLEWFEMSCRRDKKNLLIFEFMNDRFYEHLVTTRGFTPLGDKRKACVKVFFPLKFKQLKNQGNELVDRKGRSIQ